MKNKTTSGQSLFEVVLALAVSTIIIVAIVGLTSKTISTSSYSTNKTQASRYVSEAMEFLRKEKQFGSWSGLKTTLTAGGGLWCLVDLTLTLNHACNQATPGDYITGTIFQRTLTATTTSSTINIEVAVSWSDEKGTHKVDSVSAISNW